jgi:hypothetical protein
MSAWRQGKDFVWGDMPVVNLDESIVSLPSLEFDENVQQVFEAGVTVLAKGPGSAAAAPDSTAALSPGPAELSHGSVRLRVSAVRPVTHELARKSRKRNSSGQPVNVEDSASAGASDEVPDISSASSYASVDTDVDSGIDDLAEGINVNKQHGKDNTGTVENDTKFGCSVEPDDVDLVSPADVVEEGESAGLSGEELRLYRHPPGTWKVWESTWFYMTQTLGWIDIKIWMKGPFRNVTTGMGMTSFSKTLTCHHYGDQLEDPWRCMLLLRSWSIWHARWQGWAKAKDCRLREVIRQFDRFVVDLRRAHQDRGLALVSPMLGNMAAHQLLQKWSPDAITAVIAQV